MTMSIALKLIPATQSLLPAQIGALLASLIVAPFTALYALFFAALFSSHSAQADNMFDTVSGNLVVPVIRVNANLAYFATFSQVSSNPPVWALQSVNTTSHSSRTEATYDANTGQIRIPEITVGKELYNLNFRLTSNCNAGTCLEPDAASLQFLGRTGGEIFTTAISSASTYSCASCHAIAETDGFASDGLRRPGHPLLNATQRPHFKNGALTSMLDAVNICVTEWMNAPPWKSSDTNWINLRNWLQDLADSPTGKPVTIDVVASPKALGGGSTDAGRELFNKSCIVCHGKDGIGTQLAPKITQRGLLPDYISSRVRTSGNSNSKAYTNLTGGIMPFWGANRLSDGELADIVAFVASGEAVPDKAGGGGPISPGSSGSCTKTSNKIGQTLTFTRRFHNVSGIATIIDDCTIELTNFNFDGGGIDVHVYAGTNLQFHPGQGGFSILGNLLGTRYENGTLRITLPKNVTLAQFDSLSIWCVPVGVSFGDGKFSF